VARLEQEREQAARDAQDLTQQSEEAIALTDQRLDRLMQAYLDGSLTLPEYRQAKNKLIEDKQALRQRADALRQNHSGWLEPAIRFVKATESAGFLAESGTDVQRRDFLRNVGSNLTISDRHLSVVPRGAWQLVAEHGPFAQPNTARSHERAVSVGETTHVLHEAEVVRHGSNASFLLSAIRAFFQQHPDWS
jgi:hypothetical protein